MHRLWIVPFVGIAVACAGCGRSADEVEAPPRVTDRAKPKAAPKSKSAKKKSGSFGFDDDDKGDSKGTTGKKMIDTQMAPDMGEMDRAMRAAEREETVGAKFICERCGLESHQAGRCCGTDRVPLK